MKWILIGHRGVGKTSLLRKLAEIFPAAPTHDLDLELVRRTGRAIEDFFSRPDGENEFRLVEKVVLRELVATVGHPENAFIAVGAGFDVSSLNKIAGGWRVLWVQRKSDFSGRIFLARPRLERDLEPLAEFFARKKSRDPLFAAVANEVLTLPEGDFGFRLALERFFSPTYRVAGGGVTFLPRHARHFPRWQPDFIEFRTDYFSEDEIRGLVQANTCETLVSFRVPPTSHFVSWVTENNIYFDWGHELGRLPRGLSAGARSILSYHELSCRKFLDEQASRKKPKAHLKFSPVVNSFTELRLGWEWQRSEPTGRSFLPRSPDGRWRWYRLRSKGHQKINFICDGSGSAEDQPTVLEWLEMNPQTQKFFAVIGDPVDLSWSPSLHKEWAHAQQADFFSVKVSADEIRQDAIPTLKKMGAQGLAVTAPLKQKILSYYENLRPALIDEISPEASQMLSAVNTLVFQTSEARLTNTDAFGFQKLWNLLTPEEQSREVVVWGGGGTLPILRSVLPKCSLYSATTATVREDSAVEALDPRILIWAAGPHANFPRSEWKIEIVVDLNYREDSVARAYALRLGARYFSGEQMFITQAKAQQKYWEEHL